MNKNEFLRKIEEELKILPEKEKADILRDYEEYFSQGDVSGNSEEEMVAKLGDPRKIAKELLSAYSISEFKHEKKGNKNNSTNTSPTNSILTSIVLIILNMMFVVGPVVSIFTTIISIGITGAALVLVSPVIFGSILMSFIPLLPFHIFITLFFFGIGILLTLASVALLKLCWRLLIKYIKFNKSIVERGIWNV